jgi:hypothetical protein
MSDLTIPIIGLTTLIGYFFSQNGRNDRDEKKSENVEPYSNGENIYESKQYDVVNREILERSYNNYKKAEDPAMTGVLPPLYNTYGAVGSDSVLKGVLNQDQNKSEIDRVIKTVDVTRTEKEIGIDNRPMFQDNMFKGIERNDMGVEVDIVGDKDISLLTGKPIDTSHTNMVPFFGSSIKQNVEKFTEPILDLYSGNTSTFKHKKEISSLQDKYPQDIYQITSQVDTDRIIPSLYRQNEKPFKEERIAAPISGTINNVIYPKIKNVDELRVMNNPKETYDGRTIAGQFGEVRGLVGDVHKRRPETYYEKSNDHWFKTTGEYIAPKTKDNYDINFRDTSRGDYNISYFGGSSANKDVQETIQRTGLLGEHDETDRIVQIPKRQNYENDYTRNVIGNKTVNDYGISGITTYETERATTGVETHALNVNMQNRGVKTKLFDDAKTTIKETTLYGDNSGNIKTTFSDGMMGAYDKGITNMNAKTTHKETTLLNNYKGIMTKDEGMGYAVNKYEAKTTGKEIITNKSSHTGNAGGVTMTNSVYTTYDNPEKVRNAVHAENYRGNANFNSEAARRDNYKNAYIRDTKESILKGQRPSGPQAFQIAGGRNTVGDIKSTTNLLLKEQQDDRSRMNIKLPQIIPERNQIGHISNWRKDDEKVDTVQNDRLQPDLVIAQHNENPYSIKKRI